MSSLGRIFLSVTILVGTALRLPAPIQEATEPTATPRPKREAVPRPKPKPAATPKPKIAPLRFAGAWSGTAVYQDSNGISGRFSYLIEISDDEKTALFRWTRIGTSSSGPPERASCTRFGEALSCSGSDLSSTRMYSMRLNMDGTAGFLMEGRMTSGTTYTNSGIISRQGASSAPPIRQTTTISPPQTTTRASPISGLPTARRVPGKSNLVFSPFDPDKYIDVEGYASGTQCKDPYTGKNFIVP